jgi:hypothetical protein
MIFRPIFRTDDRSDVSLISHSPDRGVLFTFSETGDAYAVSELADNAYGNGSTALYSAIRDGYGDVSDTSVLELALELYRSVASVTGSEFEVLASSGDYHSADTKKEVFGTYISDVLSVNDDFGYWKAISWTQTCRDSRVIVAVKSGNSREEVLAKDWERYFEEPCVQYYGHESTVVVKNLDFFNLKGSHFMFKIEMKTSVADRNPFVRDLSGTYVGKHSVFFFTNKIRIDGTRFGELIMTASSTLPARTEVSFGVGPGESVDWEDYRIVDLDRLNSVPAAFGKRMRVGIRLSSLDLVNVPVVHEFALSFESDDETQLNEEGS